MAAVTILNQIIKNMSQYSGASLDAQMIQYQQLNDYKWWKEVRQGKWIKIYPLLFIEFEYDWYRFKRDT